MRGYRNGNYSFVIDSSFQPFTFQEMLQPFVMYKDAYEKTEAAYDDLQQKANVWEGMASEQNDPETYAQYKKYADDLKGQAQDLAKNGLSMSNKRQLLDLKRRYAAEIIPIEQAYANRKAQIKEQQDLLAKDPTRLFSRDASTLSLDDYMKNPAMTYQQYSGALLAKQVNDAAASISKSLVDYMNGKPLDGNTRTWLQQHGLTATEVAQAISNPQSMRSSRVLNTLMNSVMESSGVPEWADPTTLKQAYLYASQGLWKAIGEDKVGTYHLPKSTGGKNTSATAVVPPIIPQLTINSSQQKQTPQKPTGNSGSSPSNKDNRPRRKYGTGGNLFVLGGPEDEVSPALKQMLKSMSDDDYHAFMTERTGTQNYTDAQQDSVVKAENEAIRQAAENAYLNGLYKESLLKEESPHAYYTSQPVMTSLEFDQTANDTEMFKKYGKYFYKTKNGNYALSEKGRNLYKSQSKLKDTLPANSWLRQTQVGYVPQISDMGNNEFRDWLDRRGLSEMAKGRPGPYQSSIVDGMKARIEKKADAIESSEYYDEMNHNDYPNLISRLNHMADSNNEIYGYKRVKDGKTYKLVEDKKYKVSNLENGDIKSAALTFGIHGNFIDVRTKSGERVLIPFNLFDARADAAASAAVAQAFGLRGLQKSGAKTALNGNKVENIENSITRSLNAALKSMYSVFNSMQTAPDKVVSGTYIGGE